MGVRGPPSGPRSNLAHADTGAVRHDLYVKVVTGTDPDRKSHALTLEVLRYVHGHLAAFRQMGLDVRVNRIRSQDLQNAKLVAAMQKRGITRLPALTTPNNVYLGFNEIQDIYDRNVKEFAAVGRRGERAVEGASLEDDLTSFYQDEMTFERAEEDAQEEGIGGEGGDMMDDYRRMMERRERSGAARPKPGGGGRPMPSAPDARRAAPPRGAAHPGRPDNVGSARPVDPEDAEIQETIDRLARDIDDNFRSQAFASGGGDSYDDGEGGGDFQDDLMEAAFYANQSSSDLFQ